MMRINEVNPVPVITSKKKLEIKNIDVMIGEEMNWIFEMVITVSREGKIKNNAVIGTHEKRHSPLFLF